MKKEDLHSFLLYFMLIVIYIILIGTDIRLKEYNFTTISAIVLLIPAIIFAFPYISQKYIGEDIKDLKDNKDNNTISNRNAVIICLIVMTSCISTSIYAGGILTTGNLIFHDYLNIKNHTAITGGETL